MNSAALRRPRVLLLCGQASLPSACYTVLRHTPITTPDRGLHAWCSHVTFSTAITHASLRSVLNYAHPTTP